MRTENLDWLYVFIENQLAVWPLAKRNYDAFTVVRRRVVRLGDLSIAIQFNPARIISTGASVSNGNAGDRPCFLCEENRPFEQMKIEILPDWELLVNPYPIFPVHFTIASKSHIPQSEIPADIVAVAEKLLGMVVFYNGARAGASAPDHLHLQAVLKDELPLIEIVEKHHELGFSGIKSSDEFKLDLPFLFFSGLVMADEKTDENPYSTLLAGLELGGPDKNGCFIDTSLVNAFFWIDDLGNLRFISIPRKAHRPECYYKEGEGHHLVSPGCIDMAGVIITPLEKDFNELKEEDLRRIYSDVAVTS